MYLANNKGLFNCDKRQLARSKCPDDIRSLYSQSHHGLTDRGPITINSAF